jgi:hypothetical protein
LDAEEAAREWEDIPDELVEEGLEVRANHRGGGLRA